MTEAKLYASLDEWIAREAFTCDLKATDSLNAGIDRLADALGNRVELLGLGEPTHLVESILRFRNRVFQRLVEAHGFRAIALESSFVRGRMANDFVLGQGQGGAAAIEEVLERGFSHGFGRLAANRELVEWMRAYNASAAGGEKVHLYGFDSPTEMMYADSPRGGLEFVLDYLAEVDTASGQKHREQIAALVGDDAAWENEAAAMDPTRSIGVSAEANELRVATEDLIAAFSVSRPDFVAKRGALRYEEAMHYAKVARQLLAYHAVMARRSDTRAAELLGRRDSMMADNLAYIVERERSRGRVLAFAHNMHLKCGKAEWQWGPNLMAWWPAGAHVRQMMGSRYAVIGVSVGESEASGMARAEAGTLEGMLSGGLGAARLVPTYAGQGLPTERVAAIPARSASPQGAYFPFTSQSVTDFDWLAVLD